MKTSLLAPILTSLTLAACGAPYERECETYEFGTLSVRNDSDQPTSHPTDLIVYIDTMLVGRIHPGEEVGRRVDTHNTHSVKVLLPDFQTQACVSIVGAPIDVCQEYVHPCEPKP